MRSRGWLIYILIKVIDTTVQSHDFEKDNFRSKRQINALPLVYPYGGTYKLLIGFATPVPNEDQISLVFAANFQYQYLQFQNITQLSQYYFTNTVSREQRDAELAARRDERIVFYKSVADMLDAKGLNGYGCVLRAICEAAQYPVQEEGFVGEVMHILLTPDYGRSPFEEPDLEWEQAMSPYKDAAVAGRQMFNCLSIYSLCPQGQGVLDLITSLTNE